MILAALLAVQSAPPPRIDLDRMLATPPLIMDASTTICARWTERRREDRMARVADMAWLTGVADASRAKERDSFQISFAVLLGSLDGDCERNPNALVLETAQAALTRLRSERR